MKLNVNLDLLIEAANNMGAEPIIFNISTNFEHIKIDEILGTTSGVEIEIDDPSLEFDGAGGLLSYQGRQVLLFLPKQFHSIDIVKEDYSKGNKFHIADCSTLKQQKENGRFNNYSATNNLSNKFNVYGFDSNGVRDEFDAYLNVCQNCLKKLNYQNFNFETWENQQNIVNMFRIEEFLETYSILFEYVPNVNSASSEEKYTDDWKDVSRNYRSKVGYICETCNTSFISSKHLLHTHHVNGIKNDNDISNLKAVCIDCHRKEPKHKHIMMSYDELQQVHILRKEQNKIKIEAWDDVFKFSDLSIYGYLNILRKKNEERLPEVAHIINTENKKVALDLAWTDVHPKYALVTEYFYGHSKLEDWNILTIGDAMSDDMKTLIVENNSIQIKNQRAIEFQAMVDYTTIIETKLEEMGARARGLHGKISHVSHLLSKDIIRRSRRIATIRNKRMHRKGFDDYKFQDFKNDCEIVINFLNSVEATI